MMISRKIYEKIENKNKIEKNVEIILLVSGITAQVHVSIRAKVA